MRSLDNLLYFIMMYLLICLVLLLFTGALLAGFESALAVGAKEFKENSVFDVRELDAGILKKQEFLFSAALAGRIITTVACSVCTTLLLSSMGLLSVVIFLPVFAAFYVLTDFLPRQVAKRQPELMLRLSLKPVKLIAVLLGKPADINLKLAKSLMVDGVSCVDVLSGFNETGKNVESSSGFKVASGAGPKESIIINRVLRLRTLKVMEAMRPRTEIVGIDKNSTVEDALAVFVESGFSKIPVFEENVDHIIGVILAYDLFSRPAALKEVMREVLFVPEARRGIDMLNDFLNRGISFAVVVDEFGGTAGIITMEDILEELYGEIKDEYDVEEDICRKINDTTYLINGKIEVDYINEQFDLNLPKGDYETISGFITARAGRIPLNNEDLQIGSFSIHVVRSTPVRVELVKLIVPKDTV